jgi:hypothetical protein
MSYGLTPEGFFKKSLDVLLDEIKTSQRALISSKLNLLQSSVLGQLNGIIGDKFREMWDLAEAVYRAFYPDSANDESLEGVAAISGAVRLHSTRSQIALRLFLDDGADVPAGSVVSVGDIGARFVTKAKVKNSLGYAATFEVDGESEDFGQIVGIALTVDTIKTPVPGWNARAAETCSVAGDYILPAPGGHPSLKIRIDEGDEQTLTIADGTYTAAQMADALNDLVEGATFSAENGFVRLTSDTEGTGSSVQITWPTGGGTSNLNYYLRFFGDLVKGFNALDAELGRNLETDVEFRARREGLLQLSGSATVEAIASEIRSVDGVEQVTMLINDTDATVDGLTPHSFEALVKAPGSVTDESIAQAIFNSKAAGIKTCGSVLVVVMDSMGRTHDIRFSHPTPVPIYIWFTGVAGADTTAEERNALGDAVVAALVTLGERQAVGQEVVELRFESEPLQIAGILDVTEFEIDTVYPPTGEVNILMTARQIATFDASRIEWEVITP